MSILIERTIVPDIISDHTLDVICNKALAPMRAPREKRVPELGDLWQAANTIPANMSRDLSLSLGEYTRFGNCLQQIVYLIAKHNTRFDASPDNKRVTDITLVADDKTYLLFVQSQHNTKNSGGQREIINKMNQKPTCFGIVAIVQDYPPSMASHPRTADLSPNVKRFVGPDLFSFLSDGDDTLYRRLKEAVSRWGKRRNDRLF